LEWVVMDMGWYRRIGDYRPDPDNFPNGEKDMLQAVAEIHALGAKGQLWWMPLGVDPGLVGTRRDTAASAAVGTDAAATRTARGDPRREGRVRLDPRSLRVALESVRMDPGTLGARACTSALGRWTLGAARQRVRLGAGLLAVTRSRAGNDERRAACATFVVSTRSCGGTAAVELRRRVPRGTTPGPSPSPAARAPSCCRRS